MSIAIAPLIFGIITRTLFSIVRLANLDRGSQRPLAHLYREIFGTPIETPN